MNKALDTTASNARLDADGKTIHEGSVLIHVDDGERGVVTYIGKAGEITMIPLLAHGDLVISKGSGVARMSSNYRKWRHLPREQQTHHERFRSWLSVKSPDLSLLRLTYSESLSYDALTAVDGIMALLPTAFDWESNGPRPDTVAGALALLVEHITSLTAAQPSSNP